jgi:hypothetical protein
LLAFLPLHLGKKYLQSVLLLVESLAYIVNVSGTFARSAEHAHLAPMVGEVGAKILHVLVAYNRWEKTHNAAKIHI